MNTSKATLSAVEMVQARFPEAVLNSVNYRDEQTLVLAPEHLVAVCIYLRDEHEFNFLSTVTAVDWQDRLPRFDVVYHLLSISRQSELRLKVRVGVRGEEMPSVPTVTGIWPAANWYEREVFDLFGLSFAGHPDPRRIMMPLEWTTHPLRKDYPLSGFDLPEPHWGGQVPYDVDPVVGSQTLRSADGRVLNESRSKITSHQEPGTRK